MKAFLGVLVVIACVALAVVIVTQAVPCIASGGVFVKGLPWYVCVGGAP